MAIAHLHRFQAHHGTLVQAKVLLLPVGTSPAEL
jgi:hypothetical protein